MAVLEVLESAGLLSIQDLGRPGLQHFGIVQGGAADRRGFLEGAAVLGQGADLAALEWLGVGGSLRLKEGSARAVLSGARFKAQLDGTPLETLCSFSWEAGQMLTVQGSRTGNYGYLHLGGGLDVPKILGSRATHLRAGFGGLEGRALRQGDDIPVGEDADDTVGQTLEGYEDGNGAKPIRVVWGVQAHRFGEAERARFLETRFRISSRLDRMGVRLDSDAMPIEIADRHGGLSDAVLKGDLQFAGEGHPTILLADHQPTGGYPRLATIITADHDRMAQLPPGHEVTFALVDQKTAIQAWLERAQTLDDLPSRRVARVRTPEEVSDLLSYELVTAIADPNIDWIVKDS